MRYEWAPAIPDPLQLAGALNFLDGSLASRMALSPVEGQCARLMLEDTGAALAFPAAPDLPTPSPAQRAALGVFGLAAVWREYLPTFAANFGPDTAALNLHAWASTQAALPEALSVPDAGTVAAWGAVRTLAALTAGPGFADSEPDDLLTAALSSLEAMPGHMLN